jgi:hypothetical protein
MSAQSVWDTCITETAANWTVNAAEITAAIAAVSTQCERIDGENADLAAICTGLQATITMYQEQLNTITAGITAINARMYASLTGAEQTAVDTCFTFLPRSMFNNFALFTIVSVQQLETRRLAARSAVADQGALTLADDEAIFDSVYYRTKQGV